MKILLFSVLFCTILRAQEGNPPAEFYFQSEAFGTGKIRKADFQNTATDEQPSPKTIRRCDPGSTGHLTVTSRDKFSLNSYSGSGNASLRTNGEMIYTLESAELIDSTGFLMLICDSSSADNFLRKVSKIRKREWGVYRITIRRRGAQLRQQVFIRFLNGILTVQLPYKANGRNFRFSAISPAIPIYHIGGINSVINRPGPGISFNVGIMPRRPFVRLLADLLGPASVELMFTPIASLEDAVAVKTTALGFFFNSFYGIFHWGMAWYNPTYARGEAYIGINFAPAMQLLAGGRKNRYRW